MSTMREPRLGIDIGRVIINGPAHPGGGDTAFFSGDEATMLATPEIDGCMGGDHPAYRVVRRAGMAGVQVRAARAGQDAALAGRP
jgi:hypothetical protein